MPKISIVTITYNSERTLRDTLDSVRRQKVKPFEYIIMDGGSKDSTLEIVKEYADVVTKVVSEPDEGISDAMNKGIAAATGDLIGIIHSDDMLTDDALEILTAQWDDQHDVYYGSSIICTEEGVHSHVLDAKEDLSCMPYEFALVHPSTFVTKKAYDQYGVFDKTLKCAMDYDLLLRFYKRGATFKYIDKSLAVYRMGGTNMKLRRRTIDEVREVSIRHGGSRLRANAIRCRKLLLEQVRPFLKKLNIKSRRVKQI